MERDRFYNDGYAAHFNDASKDACPWTGKDWSNRADRWRQGWDDAEEKRAEAIAEARVCFDRSAAR